MKSSTRARIVKNFAVEIYSPRLVENELEVGSFTKLHPHLAVVNQKEENIPPEQSNHANVSQQELESLAQNIISEAEEKASKILLAAEAEVSRYTQQAKQALEAEKEQVINSERIKARQEGYEEGIAEGQKDAASLIQKAEILFSLAQNLVRNEYQKVDETLLRLSLKIAQRIIRSEISVRPEHLLALTRSLSLMPQEKTGLRLHLSPSDYRFMQTLPVEDRPPCILLSNETLIQGECFLETQEGIFDARLDSQLEKLEKLLREELKHEPVEQTS